MSACLAQLTATSDSALVYEPGDRVGPFRIEAWLGQGGMGQVYRARDLRLGRAVALKVLSPRYAGQPAARRLLQRECRALAKLQHPNIVTLYSAKFSSATSYLALELVAGPNLDVLVREQGPLSTERACTYLAQVLAGVTHAHKLGLVHRDLKPANLLWQPADESLPLGLVKISDFGLVCKHVSRTRAAQLPTQDELEMSVVGTPDYLAPEQAFNIRHADARADLYSLGCTFYYLLTGRPPFAGGTSYEKLVKHATEAPIPLEELRPSLPRSLAQVVAKMLAKQPEERYQTPTEVLHEIAPYVAQPLIWQPSTKQSRCLYIPTPDEAAAGSDDQNDNTLLPGVGITELACLPTRATNKPREAWHRVVSKAARSLAAFLLG